MSSNTSTPSTGVGTGISISASQSLVSGTSGPIASSNSTQGVGLGTSYTSSGTAAASSGIGYIGSFGTGTGIGATGAAASFPTSLTAVVGGTTETFAEETDSQYASITAPTSATVTHVYTGQNSQASTMAAGVILGAGGVYFEGTNPGGIGPPLVISPPDIGGGGGGKCKIPW